MSAIYANRAEPITELSIEPEGLEVRRSDEATHIYFGFEEKLVVDVTECDGSEPGIRLCNSNGDCSSSVRYSPEAAIEVANALVRHARALMERRDDLSRALAHRAEFRQVKR